MISQFRTVANQLTLLRLIFIPFVIINVLDQNYGWALLLFVAAGLSDALDGVLARWLEQQTLLGQYLDPIADKLLLSSLFLVLSFMHDVPWKFTVIVFSRDISILAISAVLYATTELAQFLSQHLWEDEHRRPGRHSVLHFARTCHRIAHRSRCSSPRPLAHLRIHHSLGAALHHPGEPASARSQPAKSGFRPVIVASAPHFAE